MKRLFPLFNLTLCFGILFPSLSSAEDIIVRDAFDFFTAPSAGDRVIFQGRVDALGSPVAVDIALPDGGASFIFEETSYIFSPSGSAVQISTGFREFAKISLEEPSSEIAPSTFSFAGTVESSGFGLRALDHFSGTITNSGILSGRRTGVLFDLGFDGEFNNSNLIESDFDPSILFGGDFNGSFFNTGNITSNSGPGIFFGGEFEGDFVTSGAIRGRTVFLPRFQDEGEELFSLQEDDFDRRGPSGVITFSDTFDGNFTNDGTIEGAGGVVFNSGLEGTFTNTGTIRSNEFASVTVRGFDGDFVNSGVISRLDPELDESSEIGQRLFFGFPSLQHGTLFEGGFTGTFLNTGTIEGELAAVAFDGPFEGSFENRGTIQNIEPLGPGEPILIEDGPGFFEIPRSGVSFLGEFSGSFKNSGTILAKDVAVFAPTSFEGSFENSGSIIGEGDYGVGVLLGSGETGTVTNSGLIRGSFGGLGFTGPFGGTINNSGRISAGEDVAVYLPEFSGEFVNTGVIDSANSAAIEAETLTGTIRNRGGRISGVGNSIELGQGNGKVVISGTSVINGKIDGGEGDNDVLRFENIRGLSQEKVDELEALAAADGSGDTSVTLFGETFSWTAFEDIQVDVSSLESFETLFSSTGFREYGAALDQVQGLGEEMRIFLNALGELSEEELKEVAANSSGQTVATAAENYVRQQGSEVFSLFSAEFSNLRTGGGNGNSGMASNQRTGLFTREVQVGATVNEPVDESHVFITGYVGRGTQDPDANRTEATIDSTSIMFGRSDAITDRWRVGLWGGYTDNDANVDTFGSELQSEAGFIGASASYQGDYGFSNLVIGYGFHDQTTIRRDFLGNRMDGDAIGHQGLLHGQFGRDFYFGEESNVQVSPYVGFAVSRLAMGGYTENGPAVAALRFDSQTTDSVQSVVGINVSHYHETRAGWIKPKVDAAWWHEFAEADSLGVSLASAGLLNPFQIDSEVSNRDRAVVQVGMEMGFDRWENVTFDASYFGTYGEDGYTAHGGALSAEFEF